MRHGFVVQLLIFLVFVSVGVQAGPPANQTHSGMCDASAAIPISSDRFLVADDEDSILRVYRADASGGLLQKEPVSTLLELEKPSTESDLEGVTVLDGVSYWISSHSRTKKGKLDRDRHQFFALKVHGEGDQVKVTPVGSSYRKLVDDMLKDPNLSGLKLENLDVKKAKDPKTLGALSIEGLTSWKGRLLIGFRNPIPNGKALLVPLQNPAEVVNGKGKAKFEKPILLDLGSMGISSIEFLPGRRTYLIVAGSFKEEGPFRLYEWSGERNAPPEAVAGADLSDFTPKAIVVYPDRKGVLLLSDDGEKKTGGTKCKKESDPKKMAFRSRWVELPARDLIPPPARPAGGSSGSAGGRAGHRSRD